MIYLDYAATTPLDPRILEAIQPYLTSEFGNPSSIHQLGQKARQAVDQARSRCQELIGAFSLHEVLFTGSGTESCNMAIFGAAMARKEKGRHIIISALEHPAVLEPARYLRDNFGFEVTELLPNSEGFIPPDLLKSSLREDTILVSVMLANNEIGTIQEVKKMAKMTREKGVLMHTDACQAPGFLDIHVDHLGVDLLTLNGSKMYGPKGIGLLYVREGVQIAPLIQGGGQEFRMRGGTENVANIVGFAKALELVLENSKQEAARLKVLQEELLRELLKFPGARLNGSRERRLPNNVNVHFPGYSGETLVMRLDLEGIACSSGSACSSGKTEASHVLLALGQSQQEAKESLRISLGRMTETSHIQELVRVLEKIL